MNIGIELEQDQKHKISGRKKSNYEKLERDYQEAQSHWDTYEDKPSWDKMFTLINLATFNCINKKLEFVLDREQIEERALDATIIIMNSILKKRSKGKDWKIGKVSSYVHYACLSIYNKQLQFEDKVLGEGSYTYINEDEISTMAETQESQLIDGVLCLNGRYIVPDYMEKDEASKVDNTERFCMKQNHQQDTDDYKGENNE